MMLCALVLAPIFVVYPAIVSSNVSYLVNEDSESFYLDTNGPPAEILIVGNENFSLHGFPGNGTYEKPYVISDLVIGTADSGIRVINTSCYFSITNCTFYSTDGPYQGMAIEFYNVTFGSVVQCEFDVIHLGVLMRDSTNCTVAGSLFEKTNLPILLSPTKNCTVVNNTVNGGFIWLSESVDCVVDSNIQMTLSDELPTHSMYIDLSRGCLVRNNTLSNSDFGIWFDRSEEIKLENNQLYNCGLHFQSYDRLYWEIESLNNSVNGRALGYFNGLGETILDGSKFGQIVLVNCDGTMVQGGHFENATSGVVIGYSQNCVLDNITSMSNWRGVFLRDSTGCRITNGTISYNRKGIDSEYCSQTELYNNSILSNEVYGISLSYLSDFCRVHDNIVVGNGDIGIAVSGSSSHIYYNVICSNVNNAWDSGSGNLWDDGESLGNYWDDCVLGAVYLILGDSGSVDHFPNGTAGTYTTTTTTATSTTTTSTATETTTTTLFGNETDVDPVPGEILLVAAGTSAVIVIVAFVLLQRMPPKPH